MADTPEAVIEVSTEEIGFIDVVGEGLQGPRGPAGEFGGEVALEEHIHSPNPHPAYDDIPNLTLILENGLA